MIVRYSNNYGATDIEQFLEQATTLPEEERWRSIVANARYISPALYDAKHWKGNSEAERRANSVTGDSQFRFRLTPNDVRELERTTLLRGDRENRGAGTIWAWMYFNEPIGYDKGKDAHWMRAEMTDMNSPTPSVHSHPREGKR